MDKMKWMGKKTGNHKNYLKGLQETDGEHKRALTSAVMLATGRHYD